MHSVGSRKLIALLASTALHVALIAPLVRWTDRTSLDLPESPRGRPLTASLFFLQEPGATHIDGNSIATTATLQTITLPIPELPDIAAIAADSFQQAELIESAADLETVERLQGIYVKQIADRITRVLQMAAANGGAEPLDQHCIVHVIQNESGDVLDVDMDECQREPQARALLASAIRAASPLPPPPDGLAMGSFLTIDATSW